MKFYFEASVIKLLMNNLYLRVNCNTIYEIIYNENKQKFWRASKDIQSEKKDIKIILGELRQLSIKRILQA